MVQLTTFSIFDNMQQERGMVYLCNPMPFITPDVVPGNYSFVVSFGFVDIPIRDKHSLSIAIVSPNGKRSCLIEEQELLSDQTIQGSHQGMAMNIDVRNFLFEEKGSYQFEIHFDEDKIIQTFPVFEKGK